MTDDLISRQAAIEAVKRLSLGETDALRLALRIEDYLKRSASAQPYTKEEIQKMQDLEQAQLDKAIELWRQDAVEVVRCKDCIHNHIKSWNHGKRDKPRCHFTDLIRSNEFYCGFGERAEE